MDAETANSVHSQMNNSHGSFELALSPVILALCGWWIDGRLGIRPWCTVVFAIAGIVGAVAKLHYEYKARMATIEADAPWNVAGRNAATADPSEQAA